LTILVDIETRSRADLPEVGAYRYACDPSTEVLMMGVAEAKLGASVYLWVNPKYENAGVKTDPEALRLLAEATKVVAHNAPFEIAVLHETGFKPYFGLDQWECTMAMARIAGLPESLEKCCEALSVPQGKDPKGKALIRFFSIPKDDGTFNAPTNFPDKWKEFCEYCRQDVAAELFVWSALYDFRLKGVNADTWQFTLRMNDLGIPVNVPALQNAQRILDEVNQSAGEEFRKLTGLNITQREAVRKWISDHGLPLEDMRAETLLALDTSKAFHPDVARAVELYRQMSFAAAKKVQAMLNWVCPDGRMHGVFKFYGTGTGRWSAGGPQMQNAKKPTPAMRPVVKAAYEAICNGASAGEIDAVYGNPVEVISSCIRQFVHAPGESMFDADYNAIEARIAVWLSGDDELMDEYRKGVDRYRAMAALIFNKPTTSVTSDERDLGKQAILGLSYGMGADKFRTSCDAKGMKITQELAERAKDAFRRRHYRMVGIWSELDRGVRRCLASGVSGPTAIFKGISMRWHHPGDLPPYIALKLPSGRDLWYREPSLVYDAGRSTQVVYQGQLPMSTQWGRIKLYGAKMFENICQAIAADLMSHGAREAESQWMVPFALIHDQALAMQMPGQTPDQFASALTKLPPWAAGLPLKAEAKLVPYYSK
jgi:DNA polymerase